MAVRAQANGENEENGFDSKYSIDGFKTKKNGNQDKTTGPAINKKK